LAGSTSKIAIEVVANALGMDKGLRGAEMRLSKFNSSVHATARNTAGSFVSMGRSVAGFGAAITGLSVGGGLAGLGAGLKTSIDRLDDLGDRAKGIGTTAESLSKIGFIATKIGSDSESAVAGIQKMNKALGDAATKGGPAADMLGALGLNVNTLVQEDPTQAFIDISMAIGQLSTASERAAAASAIFGKGAKDLMQFFVDPSEIQEAAYRFEELHGDIGMAAGIAGEAKGKMDDLSESIKGLGEQMVIALGPDVTKMIGDAADALGKLNSSGQAARTATEGLAGAGGFASGIMEYVGKFATPSINVGEGAGAGAKYWSWVFDNIDQRHRAEQPGAGETLTGPSLQEIVAKEKLRKSMAGYDTPELAGLDTSRSRVEQAQQDAAGFRSPNYGLDASRARLEAARSRAEGIADPATLTEQNDALLESMKAQEAAATETGVSLKDLQANFEALGEGTEDVTDKIEKQSKAIDGPTDLGYTNLGMSGPIGGDMPGMSDPAYDRFMQYNTLPGGFVGGSIPDNQRTFTPPEWGSRQVDFRSNYSESNSGYGMDENNRLLKAIADGVQNAAMVA